MIFFSFGSVLKNDVLGVVVLLVPLRVDVARASGRVSIENSVAWTPWKRPVPGLARRAPKTAQMAPGLSGTENPSEMIVLLIENPTGSGRLPNQGIWPRHAGSWRGEMLLWPTRRARFAGDGTRRNRGCLGCFECVERLECLECLGGGGLHALSVLMVMGAS